MKGSTTNLLRQTRRIVLPCIAAAALILPVAAQATEAGSGAGGFSLPPGATLPPEYSPQDFSPPPGAAVPDSSTPAGQGETASNPVLAPAVEDGFDLGDAGIGAAIMAGAGALLLAAAAFFLGRRHRVGASHS